MLHSTAAGIKFYLQRIWQSWKEKFTAGGCTGPSKTEFLLFTVIVFKEIFLLCPFVDSGHLLI